MAKKLLFIRYKKPQSIFEGGERSTEMHLYALTQIFGKENLDVIHIHEHDSHRKLLEYLWGGVLFFFNYHFGLTPEKIRHILSVINRYDFLFIDRSTFGILAKTAVEAGYKGKIIGFFHNIEKVYFDAKLPKFPGRNIVIKCADRNDYYTCRYCDSIIALNDRDARIIKECYGRTTDLFLPVVMKDICQKDQNPSMMTGKKLKCLFLGAYFAPNIEGLDWFVKNVLPYVDISLTVVGKSMEKIAADYANLQDIKIVPNAPDLMPYFEDTDVMVFPIFSGGGMKVKTCESLMFGKNIIGTSEAFEGYECDYSRVGGKCDTADEFIKVLNDFSKNPRPKFNTYSREYFLSNHSIEIAIERLKGLFNR